MRIGEFDIDFPLHGFFKLDGGAMFGSVPRVLWEKKIPPDSKNRIRLALRSLLIRGKGRTILVDSGIGYRWTQKEIEIYGIEQEKINLENSFKDLGLSLDSVSDLVITHLHFDHVGGASLRNSSGSDELRFKNAKVYIHRSNLKACHCPTPKDRASFIHETIAPLEKSGKLVVNEGPIKLMPEVETLLSNGHTPGQQLVKFSHPDQSILFCGDMIPTAAHIPVPWVMGYDLYPVVTMEEKSKYLKQAAKENWLLAFCHDPERAFCQVREEDGRYSIRE